MRFWPPKKICTCTRSATLAHTDAYMHKLHTCTHAHVITCTFLACSHLYPTTDLSVPSRIIEIFPFPPMLSSHGHFDDEQKVHLGNLARNLPDRELIDWLKYHGFECVIMPYIVKRAICRPSVNPRAALGHLLNGEQNRACSP